MSIVPTNLNNYLRQFAHQLEERILQQFPPLHQPGEPSRPNWRGSAGPLILPRLSPSLESRNAGTPRTPPRQQLPNAVPERLSSHSERCSFTRRGSLSRRLLWFHLNSP
jgi:hypothetical protein